MIIANKLQITREYFNQCLLNIINNCEFSLPPENFDNDFFKHLLLKHKLGIVFYRWSKKNAQKQSMLPFLEKNYQICVQRHLIMKHLLIELITCLQSENIAHLILKGIPLDILLHGNHCSRTSVDIDLLIDPAQLLPVHKILNSLGYELNSAISSEQLQNGCLFMVEVGKDLTYWHLKTQMHIELHWKTTIMSKAGFNSKDTQTLSLSQQHQVTIFNSENNFVYLCTHAAWHNWEQLQWLVDLALFKNKIPLCWPTTISILNEKQAVRAVLEAQILLLEKFNILLPDIPHSWLDNLVVNWRLKFTRRLWTNLVPPKHIIRVLYNLFLHKKLFQKGKYLWNLALHRQNSMSQLRENPNRSKAMMLVMSCFRKN
jgi:hypothetical protein